MVLNGIVNVGIAKQIIHPITKKVMSGTILLKLVSLKSLTHKLMLQPVKSLKILVLLMSKEKTSSFDWLQNKYSYPL